MPSMIGCKICRYFLFHWLFFMTHLKDSFDSFVPRKDSFRMLVSELAWSQGLSGYFSHQVPWQFSTSLQFAKK